MRLCCPVYASARTLVLLSAALTGILAERGVSISPLSVPGCRLALCEISNQVAWGVVALPLTPCLSLNFGLCLQLQSPDPSLEELANCLTALSEYVSAHLPDQTIPTKALLRRLTALVSDLGALVLCCFV